MTPNAHVPMRSVHRIRDAEHRTRDRSAETGGATLLAVHPYFPADTELVTPDPPAVVVRSPSSPSRIFTSDHLDEVRAQGAAIGQAYRRVFDTYAALAEGVGAGFRGDRAVRSNRLREAMRDGAVHVAPVRSLIEDELDRDNRPVSEVPPDELRGLVEDVIARHQGPRPSGIRSRVDWPDDVESHVEDVIASREADRREEGRR